MDPQISLFNNFFIKNGSHGTIHTFKNYFVTVFLAFSFSKISFIQTDPKHAYHEANDCTYALANLGITLLSRYVSFVELPDVVEHLLAFDKAEHVYNRLINI